jgi:hypothetical protein
MLKPHGLCCASPSYKIDEIALKPLKSLFIGDMVGKFSLYAMGNVKMKFEI